MTLTILREAIKAVPPMKYALAVSGIVAAVATVKASSIDIRIAGFGVIVMFVLMTAVVLFVRVSSLANGDLRLPALVLTWFALLLVIVTAATLFTSIFFRLPVNLQDWIKPTASPVVTDKATLKSNEPTKDTPQATAIIKGAELANNETERVQREAEATTQEAAAKKEVDAQNRRLEEERQKKLRLEARLTALKQSFGKLEGNWFRTGEASKIAFSEQYLGRCTVTSRITEKMKFETLDESAEEIRGSFTLKSSVIADYEVPSIANLDNTQSERNCNNAATSNMYESSHMAEKGGRIVATVDEDESEDVLIVYETTDCRINGDECSGSGYNDTHPAVIEHVADDKIRIGNAVYRREQ